jgi:predicted DNA-binding transcriptional regulator AlpA
MHDGPKLLLHAAEACAALSCCRKTLYALSQPRGTIPVVRLGNGGLRWSVESLQRWIAEQEQPGTRPAQGVR